MNAKPLLPFACLLVAAACADDLARETPVADAAVSTSSMSSSDAAVPSATDAATTATAKIPLLVWVDDLVDNHTHDDAVPDTVDDKNIADDENPSAFDSRFK